MLMIGGIVLGLVLLIGINVGVAARHAATFPKYWQDKANEPVPANVIRCAAHSLSERLVDFAAHGQLEA